MKKGFLMIGKFDFVKHNNEKLLGNYWIDIHGQIWDTKGKKGK